MLKISIFSSRLMRIEPIRRQSMISLISQISLTFFGFLSTMYFARTVGASTLGAYFLFLAYFNTLSLFFDGGFGGAVVKRISEGKNPHEFFSAFFVIRMILITITIAVLFLISHLITDMYSHDDLIYWLLIALAVGFCFSSILYGIYGMGKVGIYQTIGLSNNLSCIIFQLVAVFLGFGAAGLVGGFIFGMVAGSIIGKRYLDMRFVRFGSYHLQSLFSYSFWIFLSSSGSAVYTYADTLLIGYFLEDMDVGIYRVAFQFTTIAAFTTIAVRTVLFPNISKWSAAGNIEKIEAALTKAFTYSLILAVPILVGGLLLGDKLLYFFYGSEFEEGNYVLYLLLVVQVINVFVFLQTMSLNALDLPKHSLKVTAASAVSNILLNIVLIPILGIEGAAFATLLTMALNALLAYLVLSKSIKIKLNYMPIAHILMSSLLMAVVVGLYRLLIPLSSIYFSLLPILLGGFVYVSVLLWIDKDIRNEVRTIFTQLGLPLPTWFRLYAS